MNWIMNNTRLGKTLFLAIGLGCFTGAMRASGTYVKLDYPASTVSNELQVAVSYTLWIPDGVKTLRGIIVHQHGAGTTASIEGSTAAYDLHWQALAKKWDCALWGSSYHVLNEKIDISAGASELWFDPRRGSEKTVFKGLGEFGIKAGHPEMDKGGQRLKPMDTSKAWLAPLFGDEAKPAAEFKGNPNEAVWLPNEAVAKAWMEYVKTGATSDTTPPPAPFNVTMSSTGDHGTEIAWDAEADFESGISNFIVLRDGQELAKVPEKPIGKFGRPLFQSMTYHDTPSQPMPEMRYLDASAKPGETHIYSIITVSSVGLR